MIDIPTAISTSLGFCQVLPSTSFEIVDSIGRYTATDILSQEPVPSFRASIKDGYAVVSSDGIGEFPIVGYSRADIQSQDVAMEKGSVMYVTTGAPVPNRADAVVQVEDTEKSQDAQHVKILKAATKGQDIREIGSDMETGTVVLQKGTKIGPAEVGLLATVGLSQVQVTSAPKVGVLSTGNEIVNVGSALEYGQVRDSNRPLLLAALRQLLPEQNVVDLGIARDDPEAVRSALSASADLDVLITSGGVSMGDRDFVKPVLQEMGTIHFGRVLMKPGKPLTFATIDEQQTQKRRVVFGLPGNPVSSYVTFMLVVYPCIRKMMGVLNPELRRIQVRCAQDIVLDPVRPEYHRVTIRWTEDGMFEGISTGNQISSRLLSVRGANAFLELPKGPGRISKGDVVNALLIDSLFDMPLPSSS
eukprot:TRINITY_DN2373_c0_g1_i1.p2 TRINITY_DN2373_c0_g1~~TRINITY_DN2373_c0_g1_i1.p2  ORF type:complete len:431 (-),score=59.55 TRINITY_DN2373_c0_g1_i1:394-1644(-)